MFGAQKPATGGSIFGSTNADSSGNSGNNSGSLFGNTSGNTGQSSLFGASTAGATPGGSLFGSQQNNSQNQNQNQNQNQGQSNQLQLQNQNPQTSSIFGGSTSNSPSIFNQGSGNSSFQNSMSPPQPQMNQQLVHSHSNMELSSSSFVNRTSTPNWKMNERRVIPSHMTPSRHRSSFQTPDRTSSSSRHNSVAAGSSPPATFGQSFGTPKPQQSKRESRVHEDDLPPTQSIYDVASSATRNNKYSSLKRQPSTGSSAQQSSDKIDDSPDARSVVVFGFPASLSRAVVNHFKRFGTILENVSGGDGTNSPAARPALPIQAGSNWIKVTYANASEAQRALGENGKMFAEQFLIGCVLASQLDTRELTRAGENTMKGMIEEEDDAMEVDSPPMKEIQDGSEKSVPRTISMPALTRGNNKRIEVKENKGIFNTKRNLRVAPSMNNVGDSKKYKPQKQGWLSWTTKRAQELVFGWDDL